MTDARFVPVEGAYALECPFHADLVKALKELPAGSRTWDPNRRAWIIRQDQIYIVQTLVQRYLGVQMQMPSAPPQPAQREQRTIRLEYLARCREWAGFKQQLASGCVDGSWNYLFPEQLLRDWFSDTPTANAGPSDMPKPKMPVKPATLFEILVIKQTATDQEIKDGYRRQARQWHPDVCKEPDAAERIKEINRAYNVLKDMQLRKKYLAGLKLEQMIQKQMPTQDDATAWNPFQKPQPTPVPVQVDPHGYRTRIRCGMVTVTGQLHVGKFVVTGIQKWDDIFDDRGRMMVSSWPSGGTTFEVTWF